MPSVWTSLPAAALHQNPAPGRLRDWQALDAQQTLNFARKTDLPCYGSRHCEHCSRQGKRSAFRPGRLLFNCTHDWKRSDKIRKHHLAQPWEGKELSPQKQHGQSQCLGWLGCVGCFGWLGMLCPKGTHARQATQQKQLSGHFLKMPEAFSASQGEPLGKRKRLNLPPTNLF